MQAQVKEWGNNQETRLSKDIRKSAGIELNENLECFGSKWCNYIDETISSQNVGGESSGV